MPTPMHWPVSAFLGRGGVPEMGEMRPDCSSWVEGRSAGLFGVSWWMFGLLSWRQGSRQGLVPCAFAPRMWGHGAGLLSMRSLAVALPFFETVLKVIPCQLLRATSFPPSIYGSGKPAVWMSHR